MSSSGRHQGHLVQFYDDDPFLIRQLAKYVMEGLSARDRMIVLATESHLSALDEELRGHDLDFAAAKESGEFVFLSAETALNRISLNGEINDLLFQTYIGGLVAEAAKGGRQVRAFGEIVGILCDMGRSGDAIKLEELWNQLLDTYPIQLVCGYSMQAFSNPDSADVFQHICAAHSEVYAAESITWPLQAPENIRIVAELHSKSRALRDEESRRNEAETELRRSQDELATLLETVSIGLAWIDPNERIYWVNRAVVEMLGYLESELLGRKVQDLFEELHQIQEIMNALHQEESVRNREVTLRAKDGTARFVFMDCIAKRQGGEFVGVQCFLRDFTAEKQANDRNRLLAALVESCEDAVISKDLNGVITSWNAGATAIFGYTPKEAVGNPVTILIPIDRFDEEPEVLRRIRAGQRIDHYETVRKRKDGTLIDISLSVSPVYDDNGKIIGASKIARDITKAKADQKRLQELAAELRSAKEDLEMRVEERTATLREAIAQMEEFSYTVSHDLRAPLRAMGVYASALLEECEAEFARNSNARHFLQRILDNCARLDQMVTDVLTFGRVARAGFTPTPVCLDTMLSRMLEHLPMLQEPEATVERHPLGFVMGHEPSLNQALSNLLDNAAKFVAPGIKPHVVVRGERIGDRLRIWVEDNGIGVDPRYQHRLFSLFERIHPELPYEGTGVGLAIVRKAVQRMGGEVGLESDGVNGSRFWIELPSCEEGND